MVPKEPNRIKCFKSDFLKFTVNLNKNIYNCRLNGHCLEINN